MNNPMIDITAHGIAKKIQSGADGQKLIDQKISEWGDVGVKDVNLRAELEKAVIRMSTVIRR